MRVLIMMLAVASILCLPAVGRAQEYPVYAALLKDYVTDGFVAYEGLCADSRFNDAVNEIDALDAERMSASSDRLAYWINLYNIYTLKAVCKNYPITSMNDLHFGGLVLAATIKATVWDRRIVPVNGKKISLRSIEHEVIHTRFDEPRAQLALACGAVSCAPLRSSAYTGRALDQQLDQQVETFFTTPRYNSFDPDKQVAVLSPLLKWNQSYFAESPSGVIRFASRFLPSGLQGAIQSDPEAWQIRYTSYDLKLNDQKLRD